MVNQKSKNELTKIVDFVFELGQLKKIKQEGFRLNGIDQPHSVAAHSLRAAQIGYILAKMEKYPDPNEVCTILVFHDVEECRTGDVHKIANRYLTNNRNLAISEQTALLGEIGKAIKKLWETTEFTNTKAGVIAKDADILESAFTAREYWELKVPLMDVWIKNSLKRLKTKSAQKLCQQLLKTKLIWWWQGLKKY